MSGLLTIGEGAVSRRGRLGATLVLTAILLVLGGLRWSAGGALLAGVQTAILAGLALVPFYRVPALRGAVGVGTLIGAIGVSYAVPVDGPVFRLASTLMLTAIPTTMLAPAVWRPRWLDGLWRHPDGAGT